MSTVFRGIIPPVVTPLTEDRRFDVASHERNIERMIEAGVHGLFILGSSGEVVFNTDELRREIMETTVRIVDGRLPILAGVIDTQTPRVLEHVKVAESCGVDGIVSTAPFYALAGMPQVERHFRVLREKTELPIYAYDLPVCVHVKLPVDMLIRLGQDGVIQGVKDSSGDDVSFRFLAMRNKEAGHPLQLFTGHEVVVDGAYMSGADGCVPGLGNVDPHGYVRQWNAYQAGDWEAVRKEQDRLADLMTLVFAATGITGYGAGVGGFKTALELLGVHETNQMPEPVQRLGEADRETVRQILVRAGLLEA
ncbi:MULTISPECIES: dihydrodipicolinate synthase family protein [unclassified Schaalia]|uniref:dihydrodipicolinate synthase family protein n=1 Tax=unclassified Schaalia TaxID=2691889 RepID=UPI001E340E05|nr:MULTISPECIES: dihydrodipicolinate synthase family protein [unclassified Schaalia]MCD4549260.1 dihydrodipicolinate synthase family protein [Schaalia sp. lx-260]MCD4557069.1 dihydrodipicolinate synthase family protein [Schaalia sp. lx-100]